MIIALRLQLLFGSFCGWKIASYAMHNDLLVSLLLLTTERKEDIRFPLCFGFIFLITSNNLEQWVFSLSSSVALIHSSLLYSLLINNYIKQIIIYYDLLVNCEHSRALTSSADSETLWGEFAGHFSFQVWRFLTVDCAYEAFRLQCTQ